MNLTVYSNRREALRREMRRQGFDALVVSLDANRYYLSGFELHDPQMNESSGRLVIRANGEDWLCTDARFLDAAKRLWNEEHILIYRSAATDINALLRSFSPAKVGFEAEVLTVGFFRTLSEGLTCQPADGLVEALRVIKDAEEIARMQRSCALNHALMQWVPSVLVPGRTEAQVDWDITQFFRNNGAQENAFAGIVAVDDNAALPHAVPGERQITDNCAVLVDVGCRMDDYCSDQTRTFWVGEKPAPWFLQYLDLVQEAQQRAIATIRPGVSAATVYGAARSYLDGSGLGHLFTHGLGHGVGLQTHEAPSLNPRSETVLRPGMVITVEPGLYLAGQGGLRWEYMVLVTEDGHQIL